MTRLITVMTYNVHGFFLAAFIFHRKLKSWAGKKKKKLHQSSIFSIQAFVHSESNISSVNQGDKKVPHATI